jgi:hypothetical protein
VSAIHAVAAAFYPTNSTRVSITDTSDSALGPSPQEAVYQINANGTVYKSVLVAAYETWLIRGAASDYQVRATTVSGTTPDVASDALSTWLSLSSSRTWQLTKTGGAAGSSVSCVLTIEIREAASGTVLDSATVTLSAEIG